MDWSSHVFISDNSGTRMDRARADFSGGLLMIAATRRMAMHDFLLVAFSVIVIVLSVASEGDKRQTVEVRDASGNLQRYSLAADDPRLAKLQSELANWAKGLPGARLTLAKWHAELADFYVGRTQPRPDDPTVVQVSFAEQTSRSANKEAAALSAQHNYWIRVRDHARQSIIAAEEQLRQRKSSSEPPPIMLGELSSSGPSLTAFGFAGVTGLGVAIAFACWIYVCPAICLSKDRRSPEWETASSNQDGRLRELRLSIPPQWVRIHQPAAVVLRRVLYSALVIFALACVIS
jgi:hypothetical protein